MKLFAPDDAVFRLFDPAELDHVCELVADSCEPHPTRYFSAIAKSLHDLALHPLHLFIERALVTHGRNLAGLSEAQALRMVLAGIVHEFSHCPTLTKSQAANNAEILRAAWLEFIVYAGAYRVYADLPQELSREAATSTLMSGIAKLPRGTRKADPQEIWDAFSASVAAGASEGTARAILMRRLDLSYSTIYRHTQGPPPKKTNH